MRLQVKMLLRLQSSEASTITRLHFPVGLHTWLLSMLVLAVWEVSDALCVGFSWYVEDMILGFPQSGVYKKEPGKSYTFYDYNLEAI